LYIIRRVFAVNQQPVKPGAGQQFGAVAAAQPQPQADLWPSGLQRLFKRVIHHLPLTQSGS
jgi:hypothetical protein